MLPLATFAMNGCGAAHKPPELWHCSEATFLILVFYRYIVPHVYGLRIFRPAKERETGSFLRNFDINPSVTSARSVADKNIVNFHARARENGSRERTRAAT